MNWDLVKGIDNVGAKEENSFILAGGSGEVHNVISHVLQPGQDDALGLACERVYSRPTEVPNDAVFPRRVRPLFAYKADAIEDDFARFDVGNEMIPRGEASGHALGYHLVQQMKASGWILFG